MALLLLLLSVVLPFAGCDHPTPLNAPVPAKSASATARTTSRQPVAVLVDRYLGSPAVDDRLGVLYELQDAPAGEALPALQRLLASETRDDLRIQLLDSLAIYDGEVDVKLAILTRELIERPAQGDVRDAALDALLNLQDRRTIVLWRKLLDDPSDEIRDVARSAIADLE